MLFAGSASEVAMAGGRHEGAVDVNGRPPGALAGMASSEARATPLHTRQFFRVTKLASWLAATSCAERYLEASASATAAGSCCCACGAAGAPSAAPLLPGLNSAAPTRSPPLVGVPKEPKALPGPALPLPPAAAAAPGIVMLKLGAARPPAAASAFTERATGAVSAYSGARLLAKGSRPAAGAPLL